jgi:hypothetical protein
LECRLWCSLKLVIVLLQLAQHLVNFGGTFRVKTQQLIELVEVDFITVLPFMFGYNVGLLVKLVLVGVYILNRSRAAIEI